MIEDLWLEIPMHDPGVSLDEFVIMPNHVHAIIGLHVGAGPCACPSASSHEIVRKSPGRGRGPAPTKNTLSIPDIIREYKTLTTKNYSQGVLTGIRPEFRKRLWQRNYYEHIIRNEVELNQIRRYIRNNPAAWPEDKENPERIT
jgi:REP element-mobilizing transposase RayT